MDLLFGITGQAVFFAAWYTLLDVLANRRHGFLRHFQTK